MLQRYYEAFYPTKEFIPVATSTTRGILYFNPNAKPVLDIKMHKVSSTLAPMLAERAYEIEKCIEINRVRNVALYLPTEATISPLPFRLHIGKGDGEAKASLTIGYPEVRQNFQRDRGFTHLLL